MKTWDELIEELCDAARWFAAAGMTVEVYRDCLIAFSAKRAERFGFSLLSQISEDGKVWLYVCAAEDGTCLATLKAMPDTGFVTIQ